MRRRRLILILFVGILFGVAGYLLLGRSREPVYKGKPYSFWFGQPQWSQAVTVSPTRSGPVWVNDPRALKEATLEADTNAIPYLVRWIAYEPSPWTEKVRYRYNRFRAQGAIPGTPATNFWENKKLLRAFRAPEGFRALGRKAEPAIPVLARLATNANQNVSMRAIQSLSYLGPKALPPVLSIITNRAPSCDYAILAMREFGGFARPALPALIQCLSDTNLAVVDKAATTLGQMQLEPALVVPALAKALRHPSPAARMSILQVLKWYGPRAEPAAAALRETAANDPDLGIRVTATNTLRQLGFKLQEEAVVPKTNP